MANILDKYGDEYLTGEKLFGDDFTREEIAQWFTLEAEAYSSLEGYGTNYPYHALDELTLYSKLPEKLGRVLGIGSALGFEFEPIAGRIESLDIVEPSKKWRSEKIGALTPVYHDPSEDGLPFPDESFDLIFPCSSLHHIPNVSYTVREAARCLRKNGILLLREPISSMGDLRKRGGAKTSGLTRMERGIPLDLFLRIAQESGFTVKSRTLTGFRPVILLASKLFKKSYNSKTVVRLDCFLAWLSRFNCSYHAAGFWGKLRPTAVSLVLVKK